MNKKLFYNKIIAIWVIAFLVAGLILGSIINGSFNYQSDTSSLGYPFVFHNSWLGNPGSANNPPGSSFYFGYFILDLVIYYALAFIISLLFSKKK